eukprot:g5550.t1
MSSSSATNAATRSIFARRSSRKGGYQQQLHSSRASRRLTGLSMRLPAVDVDGDGSPAPRQGHGPLPLSRRRVALDPPEPIETVGSALSAAATGEGRTSRLDFLRQTSATGALLGAVTCGFLLPSRPAAAAFGTDALTPEAEVAAAAAAAEKMIWLNEDSGTVSSRLSEADETYGPGFVAYLARFLLNYDEGCREYFKGKLDCALPKRDGSHIWEEFRGFVAAVGLGLHKYEGADGARALCESLSNKYASARDGSSQQLAMLFSLLPPEVQPVSVVKSLLYFPTGSASGFRSVKSAIAGKDLDLESIFGESPSALLPEELKPRYDEGVKAFFVPGVPRMASQSDVELAFGARGPFPTSKERSLTAVDFALFAACGAVGCTTTHLTVIPLDVVKTRLQTDPGRYTGLTEGVTTIAKEEGWMMLMQGFGPTLTGYLWYGITVYPGYELFKRLFIELVGPLNAALFRVPLVLAAGATATCFACIGVCPAEAVRIRQVADPAVGGMPSAIRQIVSESGWGKLYEGLPSILFRQISFGMMKFLVFDFFTADTVLSTMNRSPNRSSIPVTIKEIVDEFGLGGLFLGLQSRIVWSGAIISGQFLLYDICKTALHVSADDLRVFLDVIASAGL